MDVQVVQDNMPLRGLGITGNQTLEMGQDIFLRSCRSPGWLDHVSSDHVKIVKPGQRAMPDILERASQHMTWLHRKSGCLCSIACTPVNSSMLIVRSSAAARCGAVA